MSHTAIPGYTYGTTAVPHSALSLADFERLKQAVLFSDEDSQSLRLSYDVLQDQVEAILDVLRKNAEAANRILASAVLAVDAARTCSCRDALRFAFVTRAEDVPAATKECVALFTGKYWQ